MHIVHKSRKTLEIPEMLWINSPIHSPFVKKLSTLVDEIVDNSFLSLEKQYFQYALLCSIMLRKGRGDVRP